jgi:hypothetical protein
METLLYIILGFIAGFYVGKVIMRVHLTMSFIAMLKDLGIKEDDLRQLKASIEQGALAEDIKDPEDDTEDLPVIRIKIEQHSNTLYAFRKDTDEFMGQAATAEDLVHRLGEKMKNARLLISREDGGEFMGGRSWEYDTETKTVK